MAVVTASGVAAPFEEPEAYSTFGSRVPGLRSFRLTYGADRNLGMVGVLPGGQSQDLSPNAQQPHVILPDGKVSVHLQDAHPDGEEFAYTVAHSLVRLPGASRYQIRDVGCVGVCSRQLPFSVLGPINAVGKPILAIVGFRMFFTGARDHEVDRVGVWFDDGKLTVAFNDRNDDDVFGYLVDFVAFSQVGLAVSRGDLSGQGSRGNETVSLATPSRGNFMLTGFDLNFQRGDHKIRDIGVYRRNNDLTVIHSDGNGNQPFDWRVSFVHVGPQVFAQGGVRSNLKDVLLQEVAAADTGE